MIRSLMHFGGAAALVLVLLGPAFGQEEYRQFFKKPETVREFWKAIQFELEVGKPEIAAELMKELLAAEPKDEDFMALEKEFGMSSFLRLRNIPKWSDTGKIDRAAKKTVEELITRVTEAVKKQLADPVRIAKFAAQLGASPEERDYAVNELRRSGAIAMPEIIRILHESVGEPGHIAVVTSLPRLKDDTVAPLLAALDIPDPILQAELIEALMLRPDFSRLARRPDTDPRPYLYFLEATGKTDRLKKTAREALGLLEGVPPDRIADAHARLVEAAEAYYNHKVKFIEPEAVPVWRWDGKALTMTQMPQSQAEEYYGLRFAGQALQLQPAYERAQLVFLSLAVEKGVESTGLDKPLAEGAPKVRELLATINPELTVRALEQAIAAKRLPVVLGLVRALGEQGDVKAAKPGNQGLSVLVRAMGFPDRRVQFAAADAVLRIGGSPGPQTAGRVVDVLRRAATIDLTPRVIVADFNKERGEAIARVIKQTGFDAVTVQTGKQLMARLKQAGDIDAVLIDHEVFDPMLPDLLVQLRADQDWAAVPIIVTIPPTPAAQRQPETSLRLTRMAGNYRNVSVVPATLDPEVLKPLITTKISEAMGQPLSEAERKSMTLTALDWFRRLALNEFPGYDIRPAEDALVPAMRIPELSKPSITAVGRMMTRTAQRELANVVLDDKSPPEIRVQAAGELNRSIQTLGTVLLRTQIDSLAQTYAKAEDGPLKTNLATIFGSMKPSATITGERLRQYQPSGPAPAPAPKEKEKEKEEKEK